MLRLDGGRISNVGRKGVDVSLGKTENNIAKSQNNDIIKVNDTRENAISMNINSIEQPIEQRHTGKGKPNAVLTFGTELNNRQKELLTQLPEYDSRATVPKKTFSMSDLSALTAYTGDEFAMFTKGGERLIIRGDSKSVNIGIDSAASLSSQGYRWSGHTHPGMDYNCLFASTGDKNVLREFRQKTSVIYNSKGQYLTFDKE